MDFEPPYEEAYKTLGKNPNEDNFLRVNECELPLIDLNHLDSKEPYERNKCKKEIYRAAKEWGFFQVTNHEIPLEILEKLHSEQMKIFHQPFDEKIKDGLLNLSRNSYRWGNPSAICSKQFLWSEAFHIPLNDISKLENNSHLRSTMEAYANAVFVLAERLAQILVSNLGDEDSFFEENSLQMSSYLRLNRYPPCPFSGKVFGLLPHTDSDFLTIVYQDQVGGLQLLKKDTWFSVKPNPRALIVNIGDLFQALSNGVYKSITHRVIAAREVERFSVAYFYCPCSDAIIQSCIKPAVYRNFSFLEYREQTQKDVQETGDKVGLSRFLI